MESVMAGSLDKGSTTIIVRCLLSGMHYHSGDAQAVLGMGDNLICPVEHDDAGPLMPEVIDECLEQVRGLLADDPLLTHAGCDMLAAVVAAEEQRCEDGEDRQLTMKVAAALPRGFWLGRFQDLPEVRSTTS
jgi:hypothetical protein